MRYGGEKGALRRASAGGLTEDNNNYSLLYCIGYLLCWKTMLYSIRQFLWN